MSLETLLQLRGAIGLHGLVPACGGQTLSAGNRARQPGLVGHVLAEVAALVGHQHHVILGGLGEQRHLRLGAAALVVVEAPGLFHQDAVAETLGRAPQRLGVGLVVFGRADDQHPAVPAPRGEKLAKGVGEHVSTGQRMQHVDLTVLAAQRIVRATGVDQQAVRHRFGELAQRRGRRVDHEQAQPVAMLPGCLLQQVVGGFAGHGVQHVAVLEEAPGAVAVGDGEFGPTQAGVLRFGDHVGEQRTGIGAVAEIADTHLKLGPGSRQSEGRAAGEGGQQTGSS